MLTPEQLFAPLFLPADKLDKLNKVVDSGASCVFIDLEDGLSESNRDYCLHQVAELLQKNDCTIPMAVRICALSTTYGRSQFERLEPFLTKTERTSTVNVTSQPASLPVTLIIPKANQHQVEQCMAANVQPLVFIEDIQGLNDLRNNGLAEQSCGLLLGAADMAASLHSATSWEAMLMVRNEMIFASALAQVPCVDTPYFQINDSQGLMAEAKRAFDLGFLGKMAIHPNQIEPIMHALTPSQQEYDIAAQIVAQSADGASKVAGIMVDRPVQINAQRLVDRYLWVNKNKPSNN